MLTLHAHLLLRLGTSKPRHDTILHLRDALTSERGLVHNSTADHEDGIARNNIAHMCILDQREQVAGHQVFCCHLLPTLRTEHQHRLHLVAHVLDNTQRTHAGKHRCGFKGEYHEEGEQRVLPVGVQTPEQGREYLEDCEWTGYLLPVQIHECGRCHLETVGAIELAQLGIQRLAGNAGPLRVVTHRVVAAALHLGKAVGLRVEEVLTAVEVKEWGAVALRILDRHQQLLALVRTRNHMHMCGLLGLGDLAELHQTAEANRPLLTQDKQHMRSENYAQSDTGPEAW